MPRLFMTYHFIYLFITYLTLLKFYSVVAPNTPKEFEEKELPTATRRTNLIPPLPPVRGATSGTSTRSLPTHFDTPSDEEYPTDRMEFPPKPKIPIRNQPRQHPLETNLQDKFSAMSLSGFTQREDELKSEEKVRRQMLVNREEFPSHTSLDLPPPIPERTYSSSLHLLPPSRPIPQIPSCSSKIEVDDDDQMACGATPKKGFLSTFKMFPLKKSVDKTNKGEVSKSEEGFEDTDKTLRRLKRDDKNKTIRSKLNKELEKAFKSRSSSE